MHAGKLVPPGVVYHIHDVLVEPDEKSEDLRIADPQQDFLSEGEGADASSQRCPVDVEESSLDNSQDQAGDARQHPSVAGDSAEDVHESGEREGDNGGDEVADISSDSDYVLVPSDAGR